MIDSTLPEEACSTKLAIIISYPTSTSGIIVLLKWKYSSIKIKLAPKKCQVQINPGFTRRFPAFN